jgi:hypothetical protein
MKPILTLKMVPNPAVPNPYPWKRIHVLQFNFDGRGSALLRYDDKEDLEVHAERDVTFILMGDPYSGQRWYRPE